MKKAILGRLKQSLASSMSLLVMLPSVGLPSQALAQTMNQAVPVGGVSQVGQVPVSLGNPIGAPALFGAQNSMNLGASSVLPGQSAPAVTVVSVAAPQSAPAVKSVPTAAAVKSAPAAAPVVFEGPPSAQPLSNAVFKSAPAGTPAARRRAQASAQMRDLSEKVQASVQAAGPLAQAGAEKTEGLGSKLMRLLTGRRERDARDSSAAPTSAGMGSFDAKADQSGVRAAAGDLKPAASVPSFAQQKMLQALDQISSLYTEHYAPIEWKQSQFGVDFKKEYDRIRAAVLAKPDMGTQEFQDLLAGFVHATRDYHVGIQFFSTERARLPLFVMSAGGKYYIAYIDRSKLSEAQFPYQAGDEIVEFDGKPVAEAVQALVGTPNVATTDARLAEMHLTGRARQIGMEVPQGPVTLKIRDASGRVGTAQLAWQYTPEMVPQDVPLRDGGIFPHTPGDDLTGMPTPPRPVGRLREMLRKLIPSMAHPHAGVYAAEAAEQAENKFVIGSRESFVPKLGNVLWEIPAESPIYAYVYENEKGQKIGYIRIPDYMGEEQHAKLFAQLVSQFQKITDGLVIDQVNNPGGSLFYMYALLSMLSSKPLATPQHRLVIDQSDAYWAAGVIQQSMSQAAQKTLAEEMQEELAGYTAAKSPMEAIVEYARFILSELKAGRRFTTPTYLFGMDTIVPSQVRYTKPIMVLINELDFSCADFFPAILQDNGRAKLFGVRTAGAGGGVKSLEVPNQLGVAGFSYTWTIGQRTTGKPIENLGVSPDVEYQITADDLRNGMAGYKKAVNAALEGMLQSSVKTARTVRPVRYVERDPYDGDMYGLSKNVNAALAAWASVQGARAQTRRLEAYDAVAMMKKYEAIAMAVGLGVSGLAALVGAAAAMGIFGAGLVAAVIGAAVGFAGAQAAFLVADPVNAIIAMGSRRVAREQARAKR